LGLLVLVRVVGVVVFGGVGAVRRRAAGAAAIIRYGYVSMPARFRWVSRDEWIGSERAHGFGGSGFALTLWRFRLLGLALY